MQDQLVLRGAVCSCLNLICACVKDSAPSSKTLRETACAFGRELCLSLTRGTRSHTAAPTRAVSIVLRAGGKQGREGWETETQRYLHAARNWHPRLE